MSGKETWDRYRAQLWHDPQLNVLVDVSRMDLDDAFLDRIRPQMDAAFTAMAALERGETANPDENRMVGHYWLRAPELAPDPCLTKQIEAAVTQIRDFAAQVHQGAVAPPSGGKFSSFLLVGIGGSALGPQFVAQALAGGHDALAPFFIDNTDPDGIDAVLNQLGDRLPHTLVLVVSKSGGTKETRNGMLEVKRAFAERGLDFGAHAVAVTGVDSKLAQIAEDESFLAVFPMWDWVGGRTSELSAVGLLPAALQGIDIDGLLAGAGEMDARTRVAVLESNPAALLAAAWFASGNGRGERDMVVLPYKDRLLLFSRYLQQLVMESLGKERDLKDNLVHQGLSVYGNKGSTDQHAYVQQLRDGPDNFFATFIEVLRDRDGTSTPMEEDATSGDFLVGFFLGTREALYEKGRRSITITLPEVSAFSIGMLIALYERAVGLYASLVGINAYHQPGVEAGKKAATRVLDLQRRALAALREEKGRVWGVDELAAHLEAGEESETLFKILEHAAANPDHRVIRTAGVKPWEAAYSAH